MLLFLDGQAHYDTARLAMKYTSKTDTAVTWAVVAEGRTANCIRRTSVSNQGAAGYLGIVPLMTRAGVWTPQTSGVLGFAIKVDVVSRIQGGPVIQVCEGSNFHLAVHLNTSGTFTLYADGSNALAHSAEGLQDNTWAYVEFKWGLHNTTGTAEVRMNGTPVLTYTGNTLEQSFSWVGTGVWNSVRVLGVQSEVTPYLVLRMCDLYLADLQGTGDDVRNFLGDGTVVTIRPNNVGSSTGWTPNTGANWDTVNEAVPDDETTYVSTATVGAVDTYQFEDLPGGSLVKGAQVCLLARKTEEGASSVATVINQGSDLVGPTQGVASVAYDRYLTQPYDINPATTAAWTEGQINAGQFGLKKMG